MFRGLSAHTCQPGAQPRPTAGLLALRLGCERVAGRQDATLYGRPEARRYRAPRAWPFALARFVALAFGFWAWALGVPPADFGAWAPGFGPGAVFS